MQVIELRNPHVLAKPDVQQLLKRGVESDVFIAPNGFETVAQDIFNFVVQKHQFMLLGAENGAFKGVILGWFPTGNLFPYPSIVLFYNEGSRALSREMQDYLLDFIVSNGYTRMLAVNSSGHKDEVWLKGLTPQGASSKLAGSLAVFEVK